MDAFINSNRQFLEDVKAELEFAEKKHKGWPSDSVHASAIINEEAGKLTQACIDHEYGHKLTPASTERMWKKAVSTAAMAIRFAQGFTSY